MESKGLGKVAAVIALSAIVAVLPTAQAQAQGHGRGTPTNALDGEPTDPDGVLPVFSDAPLKVGDTYGLSDKGAEQAEAALPAWLETLLEVLRALGLIPVEGSK